MSKITKQFDKICKEQNQKVAFYFAEGNKLQARNFAEVAAEVRRAKEVLLDKGVRPGDRLLAFAEPNYRLIIFMLATLKIGASIMYIDIFARQDTLRHIFAKGRPEFILASNRTRLLKPLFQHLRKIHETINVDEELSSKINLARPSRQTLAHISSQTPALITATTGSSGQPKFFVRTHQDLYDQLELIAKNQKRVTTDEEILTTSYIYAFANLLRGYTTVLPCLNLSPFSNTSALTRKLKIFAHLNVTTIMTSPDFCLRLPNLFPKLKRLYFGGAILNAHEAGIIQKKYSQAEIWYIYGSTECALIAAGKLQNYLRHLEKTGECVLGKICEGVHVRIDDKNHILVSSKALLRQEIRHANKMRYYDTNDIGNKNGEELIYLGKTGTEIKTKQGNLWANQIEQQIIINFAGLTKCAVVQKGKQTYVFGEGQADDRELKEFLAEKYQLNPKIIRMRRIPRDVKHHTKINYRKLKHCIKQ